MTNTQKIGVTACIIKNGKVLLLRRAAAETFLAGYFEMPGGNVEFGESPEEALEREIKEELGIKVRSVAPYWTFSYTTDLNNTHAIDIQYLTDFSSPLGEIRLSDEHDQLVWAAPEDIADYQITDAMKQAIEKGFKAHTLYGL